MIGRTRPALLGRAESLIGSRWGVGFVIALLVLTVVALYLTRPIPLIETVVESVVAPVEESTGRPLGPPMPDRYGGRAGDIAVSEYRPFATGDTFYSLGNRDWLSLPFAWPLRGWVSTEFLEPGPYWVGGYHQGIDIAVGYDVPVRAASAGVVPEAENNGFNRGYGNYVKIDHHYGVITLYGHMEKTAVKAGDHVARGQVIGYSGSSGVATGPHLHFEVRVDGYLADPELFLPPMPTRRLYAMGTVPVPD